MCILFVILTHDFPRQTLRLLDAIYNEVDHYVIHVDASADPTFKNLLVGAGKTKPNIEVISRVSCSWGSFRVVQATIEALASGREQDRPWTHAVILSGTHLPLWPIERIRSWLVPQRSMFTWNDMAKADPSLKWTHDIWDRIIYKYKMESDGRAVRTEKLGPPDFNYFVGSQWVILARHHVEFILKSASENIYLRLAESNVPDESFFHTLILNSQHRSEVAWSSSTLCYWREGSWSPKMLDLKDYCLAVKAGTHPFARKFGEDLDSDAEARRVISAAIGAYESQFSRLEA
ncbi:beta-1,6-N-acetylglucosaminyltransferase [Methylobacterium sp. ID0610]|uniref:beta-1,6-N-acetylglucosaminyltransferase n=1 Tax=Methylobacterium carpenticola TaxID=3344827 RepID=UPI0036C207AE